VGGRLRPRGPDPGRGGWVVTATRWGDGGRFHGRVLVGRDLLDIAQRRLRRPENDVRVLAGAFHAVDQPAVPGSVTAVRRHVVLRRWWLGDVGRSRRDEWVGDVRCSVPRGARPDPAARARRAALAIERRRLRAVLTATSAGFAALGVGVDAAFRQPGAGLLLIGFGSAVVAIATAVVINEPPWPGAVHRARSPRRPRRHESSSPRRPRRHDSSWGPPALATAPPPPPAPAGDRAEAGAPHGGR
jgi:hypothetical protein